MKKESKEIIKAFIRSIRQFAALLERIIKGEDI